MFKGRDKRHDDHPQEPAGEQAAGNCAAGFQADCLNLLKENAASQSALSQEVANLAGQGAFLRQQVSQMYDAVRQLYDAVGSQCRQLLQSDQTLQQELQRFQTGGPQRAMAAVFHKLFRELVAHVGELDQLLSLAEEHPPTESEAAWLRSVGVVRNRFEDLLKEWGCVPVPVAVREDLFDPEIHEAAPAEPGVTYDGIPEHVIVKVRRRGWALHGQVLMLPLVVVS
jgi:molecular chaperone GrpE (heat shock protein)